uniref:Eukaryotic translation initiation factor 3 subunit H n=1 Tax=Daphnia carinata TaxID=120202 RepID=A0A4Y7LZC1_9CRUS|nr:EOG090X06SH [Daphnia carinata]
MANRNRRANAPDVDNTIDLVQVDGLVVAKIIKHCHEEGSSAVDVAQGVLLGLVADTRLEVTNCFPFPKNLDENFDEEDYQMEMMRHLRKVNVDHLHVGWYQSTQQGAFLSTQFLESQFTYQTSIEESVVLIYDPLKTKRGFLHLKAYRLTPQAVALYKDNDFGADAIKTHHLSFESLYQEIRLVIHNSHLVNALLCELSEMVPSYEGSQYLDLGTASVLEKHLRSLTDNVDELLQDTNKFNIYQRQVVKQQQEKQKYVQKRNLENTARQGRGEAPLPDEDITKVFKPIPVPPRLEPMVLSAQIAAHCQQVSLFCSQALGKLFLSEALQQPQSSQQTVLKETRADSAPLLEAGTERKPEKKNGVESSILSAIADGDDELVSAYSKISLDPAAKAGRIDEKIVNSVCTKTNMNIDRIACQLNQTRNIGICFLLDTTGSMYSYINEVKEQIVEIVARLEASGCGIEGLAFVGYKDWCDGMNHFEILPFTKSVSEFKSFVATICAKGGGDFPEDTENFDSIGLA